MKRLELVTVDQVAAPPRQYTTGAAAKLCGVAPRTMAKWIDAGFLKGRRLPGSADRRVYEVDLIKFMLEREMWVPPILLERHRRACCSM